MVGVLPAMGVSQPYLSDSLKNSDASVFWQDLHGLFTLDNLAESHPELEDAARKMSATETYKTDSTYAKYQLVQNDNQLYESRKDSNSNKELTDSEWWVQTSLLDLVMRRLLRSAAVNVVQAVVERKFLQGGGRSLIQRSQLYGGFGRRSDFISTNGRFVGFVFDLRHRNTSFTINHIATQFDAEVTDFPIYLYDADTLQPLKIWTVNHSRAYDMVTHNVEPFTVVTGKGSGVYKLGYYEADLGSAHAVKKTIDFNLTSGCSGCNAESYNVIRGYQPYLGVHTFYVPSVQIDTETLDQWEADTEIAHDAADSHNWGLNVGFSINCDLTLAFVEQKRVFLEAYKQQIVYQTLGVMLKTTRNNATAQNLRGLAIAYGGDARERQNAGGIFKMIADEEKKLQLAIAAVTLDLSGIDSVCFSKKTSARGVSMGAFT